MAGKETAHMHPGYSYEHDAILPVRVDVKNKSGFIPLGHRLIVLPDTVQKKYKGVIELVEETTGRDEMAQILGTLVAVGDGCWKDTTSSDWAKPGDRIVFGKYSGLPWSGADGQKYRILNDLDVVGLEVSNVD